MTLRLLMVSLAVAFNITLACAQTAPDATVVKVNGKAQVRDGKDAEPRPLKKHDKLFSGQQVRCERGCKELSISYCNVVRPIVNRSRWTTILSINCSAAKYPRGGAPKGAGLTIISPRESQVVRPETFSLRWEQAKQPIKVNVLLKIYLGEEIWNQKDVDGGIGLLEPNSLKEKLKEAQKAGELNLILILDEGHGKEPERVKFKLISQEDETALCKRLEPFEDEPDEVLRHIRRGLAFSEYKLYAEGALELEKALSVLQSQDPDANSVNGLMRLAIMTNYQAYNDERVKQLCAALKKSGPSPIECSQNIK
jgi:hypothetical protein